jgi:hypothetical protein
MYASCITPCLKEFLGDDENKSIKCFNELGDLYKKFKIGLIITGDNITFPHNDRIQKYFNEYLDEATRDPNPNSPTFDTHHQNLLEYNILLSDKLRKKYNSLYEKVIKKESMYIYSPSFSFNDLGQNDEPLLDYDGNPYDTPLGGNSHNKIVGRDKKTIKRFNKIRKTQKKRRHK